MPRVFGSTMRGKGGHPLMALGEMDDDVLTFDFSTIPIESADKLLAALPEIARDVSGLRVMAPFAKGTRGSIATDRPSIATEVCEVLTRHASTLNLRGFALLHLQPNGKALRRFVAATANTLRFLLLERVDLSTDTVRGILHSLSPYTLERLVMRKCGLLNTAWMAIGDFLGQASDKPWTLQAFDVSGNKLDPAQLAGAMKLLKARRGWE